MLDGGLQRLLSTVDPRAARSRIRRPHVTTRRCSTELPLWADPCGERGEFHTCVTAGPMFARPIEVVVGETVVRDGFVFADIRLA